MGCHLCDYGGFVLVDVDLHDNEAEEFGGAVFVEEGDIELRNTEITENTSKGMFFGGGGIYLGLGTIEAFDSSLTDNHSEGLFSSGGAIHTLVGEVYLHNTRLKRNSSFWFGGAVYLGAGYVE